MVEVLTSPFLTGLFAVIWVNVVLSGDNAVVIALAVRSLPARHQSGAVLLAAGVVVPVRIALTIVAAELLTFPFLRIAGGLVLFWIAVKLLLSGSRDGDIGHPAGLGGAIRAIVVADLVMSLDNVIAVAAVAKASMILLVLGLAISVPVVILGATMLLKLMRSYPIVITLGAAVLGWVAGETLVTDPILADRFASVQAWMPQGLSGANWAGLAGAAGVLMMGRGLTWRTARRRGN